MGSCATIMNVPHKNIAVYTTEPSKIIYKQDTFATINNQADLIVERKKETLRMVVITDSLTRAIEVKPENSFMYWYNILGNYGLGMLVDRNNPKRYSYPKSIYISSTDTTGKYYRYRPINNEGELHLHVSLPHINSFHLTPESEGTKSNTGFWGLTIGLDYYYSNNRFVNLGVSGVSDFFVPVPAAVDISGEYELMSSRYVSISHNHRLHRFVLGYGFAYARNTWDLRYYNRFAPPPPTRDPVKKSHNAFGLIFPAYFQTGERFHLGFAYRPTLYRPKSRAKLLLEHLLSIDFAWKIRLNK
jgi:hypothetical protein